MEEKKIRFSGVDAGLSSFMKKLQEEAKRMYNQFAEEAKKFASSAKDQNKFIQERIRLLKEELKYQKDLASEEFKRAKSAYEKLKNAVTQEQMAEREAAKRKMRRARGNLDDIKDQQRTVNEAGKNKETDNPANPANRIIFYDILKDLFKEVLKTTNAKTEYDLLPGFGSVAGASFATAMTLGMSSAATQVGKEVGGYFATGFTRSLLEEQKYLGARYKVGASGGGNNAPNLSKIGLDNIQSAQLEEQLIRASGRSVTSGEIARSAYTSKGYNVDQGGVNEFLGLQRRGMEGGNFEAARFLQDAMARGIDKSNISSFLKNLNSLTTSMSESTLRSNPLMAAQMLIESNSIGGPFSTRDPRSLGLISNIQNSLTNPNSSFGQALSYQVLRQQNPNGGVLDLLMDRQKGGSEYLGGVFDQISKMGGGKDFQILTLANTLGLNGNLAAAKQLYEGRGKIGSLSGQELGQTDEQGLKSEAEKYTTNFERAQADVTNAFIESFTAGIKELAVRFTNTMSAEFEKWAMDNVPILKKLSNNNGARQPARSGN